MSVCCYRPHVDGSKQVMSVCGTDHMSVSQCRRCLCVATEHIMSMGQCRWCLCVATDHMWMGQCRWCLCFATDYMWMGQCRWCLCVATDYMWMGQCRWCLCVVTDHGYRRVNVRACVRSVLRSVCGPCPLQRGGREQRKRGLRLPLRHLLHDW